jgi:hypothetical protein
MKSVDAGAALLDERLPGWRDAVDPTRLVLTDPCNCVLGQVFGEYGRGLDLLAIDNPALFGFLRGRSSWERLTEAWRKVLA